MLAAVCLLAFVLPFDVIQPVSIGPMSVPVDAKLTLLLLAGAWLLLGRRALPTHQEWLTFLPSLVLTAIAVVAALAAPDNQEDALKFVWRFVAAVFVGIVAFRVTTGDRARTILWAITLGAGLSGVLGIAEALGLRQLEPMFSLFKVAPTKVAGELRVSGSFQYATIASMYFEMVLPLALVLAATTPRRFGWIVATAIAAVCAANVALSLTRAGILTLSLILAVLLLVGGRPHSRLRWPSLVTAAALVGIVALLARTNAVFDMRLTSEGDADWYGAAYVAPAHLALASGQPATIAVDVRNEGQIAWSIQEQHPFALGYRWLTADGTGVLDVPPGVVGLPRDVQPGETIHLQVAVQVPALPAGAYRLDWGMLQRDVVQFYERGWANADTMIDVPPTDRPTVTPATFPRDDAEAPWVVGRLDLWKAGLQLAARRPWLGFGPDNFRHFYGEQLGLEVWDERVQANNVYLEVLVDLGILGLAALLWQVLPLLLRALSNARTSSVCLGLGLSVLAFLVHGMLDSFLAFTPTALLFWMVLGLSAAWPPRSSADKPLSERIAFGRTSFDR